MNPDSIPVRLGALEAAACNSAGAESPHFAIYRAISDLNLIQGCLLAGCRKTSDGYNLAPLTEDATPFFRTALTNLIAAASMLGIPLTEITPESP